jgi:hypothetical protein
MYTCTEKVQIQRVPRYKLLLEELLKYTPASHPDHAVRLFLSYYRHMAGLCLCDVCDVRKRILPL